MLALAMAALLATLVGACASGVDAPAATTGAAPASHGGTTRAPVRIVVTTSILGDIARNVVGDRADIVIASEAPAGSDPFTGAAVVIRSGVGFDAALDGPIIAARARGVPVVDIGRQLAPQPFSSTDARIDPHWWMDPDRVTRAAQLIADAAAAATSTDPAPFRDAAGAYAKALAALDEQIQFRVAGLGDRSRVVTDNPGLGYFAARYGLTIDMVTVPAPDADGSFDLVELTALASTASGARVGTVFVRTPPADVTLLSERLAADVGIRLEFVVLTTDGLGGTGSDTATYLDLMRHTVDLLAAAKPG